MPGGSRVFLYLLRIGQRRTATRDTRGGDGGVRQKLAAGITVKTESRRALGKSAGGRRCTGC